MQTLVSVHDTDSQVQIALNNTINKRAAVELDRSKTKTHSYST